MILLWFVLYPKRIRNSPFLFKMEIGQKLRIDGMIINTTNQGYNFLNIDSITKGKSKYYVDVFLETEQTLLKKTQEVKVSFSLPFGYSTHRFADLLEDFFTKLEVFCEKPLLRMKKSNNRKNDVCGGYDRDLRQIKDSLRNKTIVFNDVEITLYPLAEKELKKQKIDFVERFKNILKTQQKRDNEREKLLNRFVYLKEKESTLKCFLEKENYSYYPEKRDKTIRIMITPQEYNQKLKKIETEMKQIAKSFGFELSDFDYLKIPRKVEYDEWLSYMKSELKQNYDNYFEGEESFEDYCERMYDEMGGIIEE